MNDTPPPRGFLRRPEPKAIGHAGRGEQIIAGALHLGGIAFGRLLSRGLELRVLGGGTALAGLALTVA